MEPKNMGEGFAPAGAPGGGHAGLANTARTIDKGQAAAIRTPQHLADRIQFSVPAGAKIRRFGIGR